ncbi:MAG: hypothetical protein M3Q95_13660 [Bacteroidota bacterium]|nr:hypothetical protein [Bacteroidota bacterium]
MSYNRSEIAKNYILDLAGKIYPANLISPEQYKRIQDEFIPVLYTPSVFVRFGLFIFCSILINAALGLITSILVSFMDNEKTIGVLMILAFGIFIWALEFFIHQKQHYRSGIDDCLLYYAVGFLAAGLILLTNLFEPLQIALIALPVFALASWRYSDSFLAALAFICLYVCVFLFFKDFAFGRLWMPFIFMSISILLLSYFNAMLKKDSLFYMDHVLKVLKAGSLVMLYTSLNYFIVREGNLMLNGMNGTDLTADIPLSGIFLFATCLIPLIYLVWGLHSNDRLILWTGLVILLLTLLTIKYRFYTIEYKNLMTITGLVLLTGSWLGIRYLKRHKQRYTFDKEDYNEGEGLMQAEAFVISQTMGDQAQNVPDATRFGGGAFGGGGAGGTL